jgi:1-acyl-sn-glycerol-3-phosphate acyltransferase
MNHQSIFDIPLVVNAFPVTTFIRFIARKRYFKWIPTVSHLLRLYQYPSVNPRANASEMKESLIEIRDTARKSDAPLCIFPEGTRTRDGEIGPFRPTGLRMILKQRPWKVYVLVGDGYWRAGKMKDFARAMSDIRGELELAGVFEWNDPKQNSDAFIEELRQSMVQRLAEMRQKAPA